MVRRRREPPLLCHSGCGVPAVMMTVTSRIPCCLECGMRYLESWRRLVRLGCPKWIIADLVRGSIRRNSDASPPF